MERNNIWKMTAKDKNGNPVESAPGMFSFTMRGPESIAVVKQHGQQLLNVMRQRIFDNTGEDPEYVVDEIEPMGHSDQAVEQVGDWRPAGAKPVEIPYPPAREE